MSEQVDVFSHPGYRDFPALWDKLPRAFVAEYLPQVGASIEIWDLAVAIEPLDPNPTPITVIVTVQRALVEWETAQALFD